MKWKLTIIKPRLLLVVCVMYGTWILGLPSTLMPAVKYGGELVARSQ